MRLAVRNTVVLLVALSSSLLFAQTEKYESEPRFENIGHGYRIAHFSSDLRLLSKTYTARSEQYKVLYDGEERLGRVGYYSISPSGRYIVWVSEFSPQSSLAGRVMLRARETGDLRDVTREPFSLVQEVKWNEPAGEVVLVFGQVGKNKHPKPSVIKLNQESSTK